MKIRKILFTGFFVAVPTVLMSAPSDPVSDDGSHPIYVPEAFTHISKAQEANPKITAEMSGADLRPLSEETLRLIDRLRDPLERTSSAARTVIGLDSRFKIDPYDSPSIYSKLAINTVLITFVNPTGNGKCTGWLIGANTVITAGHCVHSGGSTGRWNTSAVVYPGFSRTNFPQAPYGSCTAKSFHSVSGWVTSRSHEYDYGAIKLNCTIGNTVGTFGFANLSSVNGLPAIINGYPGDKPSVSDPNRATDPYVAADIVRTSGVRKLYYLNDTYGGMSGSPVWYDGSSARYAIGIHAYGVSSSISSIYNSGTRIDSSVFNNLLAWKALP